MSRTFLICLFLVFLSMSFFWASCSCGGDDDDDDDNDSEEDDDVTDDDGADDDATDDDDDDTNDDDDNIDYPNIYEDSASGLMWELNHNPDSTNWPNADQYCKDLEVDGFDDWYLPSIDELRTLVRDCAAGEPGDSCPVTNSCNASSCPNADCLGCDLLLGPAAGCYWPDEMGGQCKGRFYWASTPVSDVADSNWLIHFSMAAIGAEDQPTTIGSVLCVR